MRLRLLMAVLILFGFSDANLQAQEAHPNSQGLVDLHGVWPFFALPVCWNKDYPQWGKQAELVRTEVARVIGGSSKYTFVGWGVCDASGGTRIEITVNAIWPASEVGRQWVCVSGTISHCARSEERPTKMHLNFVMTDTKFADCRQEPQKSKCIRAIAVHEFMHAIGFLHEQLRADAASHDAACVLPLQQEELVNGTLPRSALPLFAYDQDSIMNYCNGTDASGHLKPDIYHRPVELSVEDKKSLLVLQNYTSNFMPRK